jgi:hypothetical protein
VAVLMHEANFHRFNGPVPDLDPTAEIISGALLGIGSAADPKHSPPTP